MLFITNRRVQGDRRSEAGREIAFDLADPEPGASVYFCERTGEARYTELLSSPFLGRLRRGERQQILLYIHGFNCQPELPCFPNSDRLQAMCDELSPGLVEVVPLVWPCDNDRGVLLDYYDDQVAADASGLAFGRVLAKFLAWRDRLELDTACLKHINVLAHSMGNRVLRGALGLWERDHGPVPAIFRNIFMVAPDVANDCLEAGHDAAMLPDCTRNLVVYHAADDLALRSSKVANVRNKIVRRRLGHTGPASLQATPRNVVSVDCDAFNLRYDRLGHSYWGAAPDGRPGVVLRHIVETMRLGPVAGLPQGGRQLILSDEPLAPIVTPPPVVQAA